MNRKQSKMLNRMGASKAYIKLWRSFSADKKGRLRKAYENNDKMVNETFDKSLGGSDEQARLQHAGG